MRGSTERVAPGGGSCNHREAPGRQENQFRGWGVSGYRNALLHGNFCCLCRKFHFLFQHLQRLSRWPRLTAHSQSTGGMVFQPRSPSPRQKMPSRFIMVSLPKTGGIKTTSWNCKRAARTNVFFPLLRENKQKIHRVTVLIFDTCTLDSL